MVSAALARRLAASWRLLGEQLVTRYQTAVTAPGVAPAPLPLPEVDADGSASRNPALHQVEVTPAMVAAVDAYLASKSAEERAAIDALLEVPAPVTVRMRRVA